MAEELAGFRCWFLKSGPSRVLRCGVDRQGAPRTGSGDGKRIVLHSQQVKGGRE
jgi:hypothetical protein